MIVLLAIFWLFVLTWIGHRLNSGLATEGSFDRSDRCIADCCFASPLLLDAIRRAHRREWTRNRSRTCAIATSCYTFCQIDVVPAEIKDQKLTLRDRIVDDYALAATGARWMRAGAERTARLAHFDQDSVFMLAL